MEILNNRINELNEQIEKYNILKKSVIEDFENDFISKEEYIEYEKEYNSSLKLLKEERQDTQNKLKEISINSDNNREWIDKFKVNKNIKILTKKVIDELIDDIFICENGNVKITFRYKDEYFEAIDFINQHKCDIMEKDLIAI